MLERRGAKATVALYSTARRKQSKEALGRWRGDGGRMKAARGTEKRKGDGFGRGESKRTQEGLRGNGEI
jgi:hypothetical protein